MQVLASMYQGGGASLAKGLPLAVQSLPAVAVDASCEEDTVLLLYCREGSLDIAYPVESQVAGQIGCEAWETQSLANCHDQIA